jgi:hypothetical protein
MKASPAWLQIDAARDAVNKKPGVLKTVAKDFSAVVYFGLDANGRPYAVGFRGRSQKPSLNYWYATIEKRNADIKKFMEQSSERKKNRAPAVRELKVGDVLSCSWGYDQTNIDYYLVQELRGKNSVVIVEIGSTREGTEYLQGVSIPDPTQIKGEPMVKRCDGKGVRISSFQWASLKAPVTICEGTTVFKADNWTAYA